MEEDFTKLYTAERGMNVPFPRHGLHGIAPDMKRAFDVLRLNQDELDQTEGDREQRNRVLRRQSRESRKEWHTRCLRGGTHGNILHHIDHGGATTDNGPSVAMESCTLIAVADLQLDTTHHGRVLRGTLVEKPCFSGSIGLLLQDDTGDMVTVAVYNWPGFVGLEANMVQAIAAMDLAFKEGSLIGILEPYYKTRMDVTRCVRVDSPATELLFDISPPKTAADLKAEGNAHVSNKQFTQALACYRRAIHLQHEATDLLLPKLLMSIAQCCSLAEAHSEAALFAAAATAVCDEGQLAAKAWLRLAEALEKLGCDGARDAYLRVKTLHPPLSAIAKVCHVAIARLEKSRKTTHSVRDVEATQGMLQGLLISASLDTADYIPSATVDDFSLTPAELKEKGNTLFRAGAHLDAVGMYKAALTRYVWTGTSRNHSGTSPPPTLSPIAELPVDTTLALLCNIAHCCSCLDDHLAAAQYASSALAIEPLPETGKAHFRHALALLNLGHAVEARASCERGRGLFPEEEALLALGEKIDVVLASATTQPSQQRMVEQWLDDQAEADTGAQDLPRRSSLEMQYPPLLPL